MADTLGNKKDKAVFKAEKKAAIKTARDAAKMAAGKEVKVLSAEEKIYRSAVWVMESVDCVKQFERVYSCMKSAAGKFGKIHGYRDSDERRKKCLELADKAVKDGTKKIFELACTRQMEAKTKSDYVDAIENFRRCKKFKYNIEECDRHIKECKNGIVKLETRAAYKRRGIVIAVFVFLLLLFWKSPAYPMTKGMYYESKGNYKLALANYKESGGFLLAHGNMKKCYYYLGLEEEKNGDIREAIKKYNKAEKKYDAEFRKAKLELEVMKSSNVGDIVFFGTANYVVLEKNSNNILIMKNKVGKKQQFAKEDSNSNDWKTSKAYEWLNDKQLKKYSSFEKKLLLADDNITNKDGKEVPIYFYELSREEYDRYIDIIPKGETPYWLREAGEKSNEVLCVQTDGSITSEEVHSDNIRLRQACRLDLTSNIKNVKVDKK